ncbi:VOC family protein [Angustibacter sp. McL0619]|uniref:VOC family protein n=1 Tax=Angustibacter sp. McL0619 TaxID=3415676 RepID=UPI003CEBDEC6
MTVQVHSITFDCQRWEPLVEFWAAISDFAQDPDNPNNPGDPMGALRSPTGLQLLFIPVPEAKTVKNRVHLDVVPTDSTRDEQVQLTLDAGATLVADHRRPDGSGWVVLADPEGNEFCVERSQAERDAAAT